MSETREAKHTPTPWQISVDEDGKRRWIYAVNAPEDGGDIICDPPECSVGEKSIERWPVNAEFIIRAVNCYDELVSALRHIIEVRGERDKVLIVAESALAKAEGRQ
jgi:hypothetical protein